MVKLFVILGIITAILLILIVLVQNPKGGFASNFINANQFGGVAQTNRFLERSTWTLAIIMILLSILGTITLPHQKIKNEQSEVYEYLREHAESTTPPVIPMNPQQKK
jgi:preprotein translocase subunit SecG